MGFVMILSYCKKYILKNQIYFRYLNLTFLDTQLTIMKFKTCKNKSILI